MTVRWSEGYAPIVGSGSTKGLLQVLADKITNNASDPNWTLHYPSGFDAITTVFTIKHTVGTQDVYIEFHRPETISVTPRTGGAAVTKDNYFCVEVKFGTSYTAPTTPDDVGTWGTDTDSARARFSWFMSDTTTTIRSWLPVQYWVSVDEEQVSIILAGDPSANYNDRLIAFGYMGSIKPFNEDVGTDDNSNFGVCFSSDISPFDYLTPTELNQYSDNTATGVVDINMLKTFTGFPMQAHYASFTTADEFVNKKLEGPSSYTKKYHMSPVYVFHGFDGYRGELNGIVATDRSTVVNLDEMVHKYNNTDSSAGAVPNTEDIYKVFLVNAPFSIFNNSNNVLYGVGILKERKAI